MTADIAAEYRSFVSTHPRQYLDIDGERWEYMASGSSERCLLMLPGALGTAETSFQYILAFEPSYRTISISFPWTLRTVASLEEGILEILNGERISRASLIGGSYGGFIAQSLVRRYPGRIDRLILSGVGAPRPERVRKLKAFMPVASVRPWTAVKAMMHMVNRISLPQSTEEHSFWRDYFDRVIDSITPEEWIGRLSVAIDFDQHYSFAPLDAAEWEGRVLLVDADHDFFFGAEDRIAIQSLYPGAPTRTVRGSGHSGTLDHAEEYIALYMDFLHESTEIASSSTRGPESLGQTE